MVLRPARIGDEMQVARAHVRSWQVGYRGMISDEYLDGLRAEDRAAHYNFASPDPFAPFTQVAVDEGVIRGFATTARAREADHSTFGELYALYVDQDAWGCGTGSALIEAARTHLGALGFRTALLWVLAANRRAHEFYKRDGWRPDGRSRSEVVWGVTVDSVCFCRELVPVD